MMSLRQKIQQYTGRLTAADERLVRELLANPVEASFLSAAEMANRVNVHEATAVRLAKKLGYRGYPELRADMQAELLPELRSELQEQSDGSSPAERIRRRLAQVDEDSILSSLIADEIEALHELNHRVSQAQIEAAAQLIRDAQRVFIFGHGHAMALVELMDRRLRRSGINTVDLRVQGRDLAERLLLLKPDDVILAFAFRTRPSGLQALLLHAMSVGAPGILISDTLGPLIRPKPKIVLSSRRGAQGEFHTLTVPMAICNALVLTISRSDGGQTMQTLDRLHDVVKLLNREE
ncbi:MAG: MurR/RpiR family transcriptional regulator [Chloroflexales bacterium]|nr:MurR/RpiR family transcriptional regulator [Chloroflexales bacterium]